MFRSILIVFRSLKYLFIIIFGKSLKSHAVLYLILICGSKYNDDGIFEFSFLAFETCILEIFHILYRK